MLRFTNPIHQPLRSFIVTTRDCGRRFSIAHRQLRSPLLTARRKWRTKSCACLREPICRAARFSRCPGTKAALRPSEKSRRRIRCSDARAKGIIALHLKTVFMNVSPRVMTDELAARNQERGVTRRRFVGITLASGAALLAGKSDVILGADTGTSSNMATNPTFNLGGAFTVNRLGFGAMRVTGEGIWGWPADRQNALKVLRRAVELGVNLIDTADAYGPDTSELLIAEALYPYPKGLVIATKGGLTRPGPGQWVPNCRPDHLKQALDGSLKRLRL